MISMRNRLIHGYENVDYDVVWKTLVESVPELLAQLDVAIEQLRIDAGRAQRGGENDPA
ncbi:MAG: HepT-like ribonuclease domain-containing protein [Armatimonadota bacterium]